MATAAAAVVKWEVTFGRGLS